MPGPGAGRAGEVGGRGGPGRSRGRQRTQDGSPYRLAGQLHPTCLGNKTALPFRFQVSKSEAARDGKNLGESGRGPIASEFSFSLVHEVGRALLCLKPPGWNLDL